MEQEWELRFCRARRAAIALDFSHLNPEQQKAVMATEGPLLLLAGAGSGKTTVLINRIANLIRYGRGADSDEVPDWVTEEDAAFLERYVQHPSEEERERARNLCAYQRAVPWSIIAITFTNKAAGVHLPVFPYPKYKDSHSESFHSHRQTASDIHSGMAYTLP